MINLLQTLQTLLPNADVDILTVLINIAISDYQELTNQSEYNDTIVLQMVLEKYSRLGNEGLESFDVSGISESFLQNYSSGLLSLINTQKRIRTVQTSSESDD